MNKLLLIFFLFCLGCTHAPVRLVAGNCQTRAIFGVQEVQTPYQIEYEYWSFIGAKKILLSDLLEDGPHQCEDLVQVDWSFSQRASDVLLSLLPFASRGRIFLSYSVD